jgi:hypothetical protein
VNDGLARAAGTPEFLSEAAVRRRRVQRDRRTRSGTRTQRLPEPRKQELEQTFQHCQKYGPVAAKPPEAYSRIVLLT